ncbi:MAG: hypothetical protein KZQ93_06190 [Candidatus Thiodiazotropha sp. (ex Monitilora ramsayi)]|nr:hypothetical protein [Candidatus Thiodiazotropha sp. (ex Monitilora ramsayi)]
MIPSKQQWKSWTLPSRLTAIGTLVGILGFSMYLIEKGYGISQMLNHSTQVIEDVILVVEVSNERKEDVVLYKRGEVFYWHPGAGAYHEVYTFEITHSEAEHKNNGVLIPANSSLKATVKLLPTSVARRYLDQGHMDISLYFKGDGFAKFSPNVTYTKENLNGFYIPIKIEKKS